LLDYTARNSISAFFIDGPARVDYRAGRIPSMAKTKPTAGYSGTPLAQKLGFKSGHAVCAIGAPPNYETLLEPLPKGVKIIRNSRGTPDAIHLFSKDRAELAKLLPRLMTQIRPDGMIWISWPKKAAGIPSTITEDSIREIALPLGLVDIKVCAVDETWSGLKLVIRRENRKAS
jgi:hypothetical protein